MTAPTSAQAVSASDGHPFVRKVKDRAEQTLRPTALRTERNDFLGQLSCALSDEAAASGGGPYRIEERLATKVTSGEALAALTRALRAVRPSPGTEP